MTSLSSCWPSACDRTAPGRAAALRGCERLGGPEYVDHGVSASRDRRRALDALLRDARHRRFNVLLYRRLDRLGRNVRHPVVEQKLGSALFAEVGLASPVPEGSFFDMFPVSVLTTSTLERLSELGPKSSVDQRRFRMNVVVATSEPGFLENDWVGHELGIGPTARLVVALPDPRCVMTTLAQDDLPKDTDILRTLARHNRIQVGDIGQFPCACVYAVLDAPGPVRTGDRVRLS